MIPKYVGVYIGKSFKGVISNPTVCVSDKDNDCWTDDFTDLKNNKTSAIPETGEIPHDGGKPEVEIDVPENQISDVTEYSFGVWMRF